MTDKAIGVKAILIMNMRLKGLILALSCFLLIMGSLNTGAYGSLFSDPNIPDGEQIVWRVTSQEEETKFSTITWRVKERGGDPVYEISLESARKKGIFFINRSDMRMVYAHVLEETEKGDSELTVEFRIRCQYLLHKFRNKKGKIKEDSKQIDSPPNGYNGLVYVFSLRGFPFGKQDEIDLKITPGFFPRMPLWVWKMWDSYTKFLGEERITVPAGTFDCYKLEMAASGGLIKRFTSTYHFWYMKEPPHQFVKFQDEDAKKVTELMEIKSVCGE